MKLLFLKNGLISKLNNIKAQITQDSNKCFTL